MNQKSKPLIERLMGPSKTAESADPLKSAKYFLSSLYSNDALLLINRYDIVKDSTYMENKNFRSKAFVDLLMSIESSLKSTSISLSKESMNLLETYKEARNSGHRISDLFKKCKELADSKYTHFETEPKEFLDIKLLLGVHARYSLDVWSLIYNEEVRILLAEENILSRTIDNPQWFDSLRGLSKTFYELSQDIRNDKLSPYKDLTGVSIIDRDKLLKEFLMERAASSKTNKSKHTK